MKKNQKKQTAFTEAKGLYNPVTGDMKGKRMMVWERKAGTGSDFFPRPPGSISFLHLFPLACSRLAPVTQAGGGTPSTSLYFPKREQNRRLILILQEGKFTF